MKIEINKHSSIKLIGEKVIYFDPFELDNEPHDADIIFFTHSHYDHLSPKDASKCAKADTVFVAPASCEKDLSKNGFENAVYFTAGEEKVINGVAVRAVPAHNKIKPFHPKMNGWLGYVVTLDGETVYVAGDTDALKENETIVCDTALVPVGGMFTMSAKEASEFINAMAVKPKKAIPTHYGSVVGKADDGEKFASLVEAPVKTELLIK